MEKFSNSQFGKNWRVALNPTNDALALSIVAHVCNDLSSVRWCSVDRSLSHAKSIEVSRMSTLSGNYGELLVEIKQRIRSAQYEALRAVNKNARLPT